MGKQIFTIIMVLMNLCWFEAIGQGNVTDIDGNVYPIVIIGEQEWMAENLRVSRYRNGEPLHSGMPHTFWQQTTEGVWAWYDDNPANDSLYGKLYNWYATTDPRGLCPAGWRVPSDNDWQQLAEFVDPNYWGNSNILGRVLRSKRQVGSPFGPPWATGEHPRWNSHPQRFGTDDYGFNALPGGGKTPGNAFVHLGQQAYFWSSTSQDDERAWVRTMMFSHRGMSHSSYLKNRGMSVRCIKGDEEVPEITIPQVVTSAVTDITDVDAISGGDVICAGGDEITNRGIVWSTSPMPDLQANSGFTTDGTGTGPFTSQLTGLQPETTYYVRAYATNGAGTGYGDEVVFETTSGMIETDCLVLWYPFDGNAAELTGNGSEGLILGATPDTDRFGNANSAFYFNGETSTIQLPGNLPVTNTFSISFWAYSEKESGTSTILTDGSINMGGNDFLINFRGNEIGIRADKSGKYLNYEYNSPAELRNLGLVNQWVHVVWIMNAGLSTIYLDGTAIAQINIEGTNEGYHDDFVTIGARRVWTNPDGFFKGKLDDLRIYSCPLTPEQVNDLYDGFHQDISWAPCPGMPTVTDIDGNVYNTVLIGDQCWLRENLKVLPSVSPSAVSSYTEPVYYVHGYQGYSIEEAKQSFTFDAYGVLYNWTAAMQPDLCPAGWRLPDSNDWTKMEREICALLGNTNCETIFPLGTQINGWRGSNEGAAVKSCFQVGAIQGDSCATTIHPRWNQNNSHPGLDVADLSLLPGGSRAPGGTFVNLGAHGDWWTSDHLSYYGASGRTLILSRSDIYRKNDYLKNHGFSVRCVRDN